MAGEFGQVGALAYRIPQRFSLTPEQGTAVAQQTAAAKSSPEEIQQLQIGHELLAETEKLTDDYYNNYATLSSFVKDMARQGIDVSTPDYSLPGGGEGFKTFQRMKANYYHGANALAVEQEARKTHAANVAENKERLRPGTDTSGFYASDPNNWQNIQVDPTVKEMNAYTGDEFSTAAEAAQAKALNYDPLMKQYQEERQAIVDAGGDTYNVDQKIKGLVVPNKVSTNIRTAQISAGARAAAKTSFNANILKDWINVASGVWNPKDTVTRTDPEFGKVTVYTGRVGKKVGSWPDAKGIPHDKIIKEMFKTPSGRVFAVYADPEIPRDEILDPQDYSQNAMSETAFSKGLEELDAEGLVDDYGTVNREGVYAKDKDTWNKQHLDRIGTSDQAVMQGVADINAKLDKLKTGITTYTNDAIDFDTPKGKMTVKVTENGKRFTIVRPSKLWPGENDATKFTKLTKEDVARRLHELGYLEDAAPAVPSSVKAPTAEELKADELLNKYRPK